MPRAKEFLESIQTKLYEFANPISKTEDKITELGIPILNHLIKILKWNDQSHNQKHCKDIDNWLGQVEDYFHKSAKKPRAGKVYDWLYGEIKTRIPNKIRKLSRQYGNLLQYREDYEVEKCLEMIFKEIDNQLQTKGEIDSIIEICQKLKINLESCQNYWK